MAMACLEWFLWLAAFLYCLFKVFQKVGALVHQRPMCRGRHGFHVLSDLVYGWWLPVA